MEKLGYDLLAGMSAEERLLRARAEGLPHDTPRGAADHDRTPDIPCSASAGLSDVSRAGRRAR